MIENPVHGREPCCSSRGSSLHMYSTWWTWPSKHSVKRTLNFAHVNASQLELLLVSVIFQKPFNIFRKPQLLNQKTYFCQKLQKQKCSFTIYVLWWLGFCGGAPGADRCYYGKIRNTLRFSRSLIKSRSLRLFEQAFLFEIGGYHTYSQPIVYVHIEF